MTKQRLLPADPPFSPLLTPGPAMSTAASDTGAPAAAKSAIGHHAAHCLHERFKTFIRPFRGPATRHLDGYAAWFTIGSDGSKERRLATAWTLLLRGQPTEFADIRDRGADAASAWVTGGRAIGARVAG